MESEVLMPSDYYGENVFNIKTMRSYLSEEAYNSLLSTITEGHGLDGTIANEVAEAMKTWALERGATHFTHWFQPLTGATAEKHDSFIMPDREGGVVYQFSGKELIQGEPDASSFPSGGLRATFEARGYTAWDPTSPAFIKDINGDGATLCIPTVFCGYHGEALDMKTPLMRSMAAIATQINRLAKIFGVECTTIPSATLGAEQEYFLVDREFYLSRLDLLQTGRTLFGNKPSKHQQMEDHYFGAIKSRILRFMSELDSELWRLGIPAKTRHNEVCPGQFEIAPVFEELNLAVDHNMVTMEVLREVAERNGLVCLLHEKPFAGVNGSGKHNNWSIAGPDGKNWMTPGKTPHDNAKFLTIICTLMMAVDKHADLLRAAVASAGNDHRLGANEAPPAIISIFLGEQLFDVIEQIEQGGAKSSKDGGVIEIGVDSLPQLPRDATDRNRTSPFAFTGNKFEFRAVGSNQNCSEACTVLNTIMTESLDEVCTRIEAGLAEGKALTDVLQPLLQDIVRNHKRILFNGDNYTEEWVQIAESRGLPNLKKTPEAIKAYTTDATRKMYEKYGVLTPRELESRYEIYRSKFNETVEIEARCALQMVSTLLLPAAIRFQSDLAKTINRVKSVGSCPMGEISLLLTNVCELVDNASKAAKKLDKTLYNENTAEIPSCMDELRMYVDQLEAVVPEALWPLASYAEMMFLV